MTASEKRGNCASWKRDLRGRDRGGVLSCRKGGGGGQFNQYPGSKAWLQERGREKEKQFPLLRSFAGRKGRGEMSSLVSEGQGGKHPPLKGGRIFKSAALHVPGRRGERRLYGQKRGCRRKRGGGQFFVGLRKGGGRVLPSANKRKAPHGGIGGKRGIPYVGGEKERESGFAEPWGGTFPSKKTAELSLAEKEEDISLTALPEGKRGFCCCAEFHAEGDRKLAVSGSFQKKKKEKTHPERKPAPAKKKKESSGGEKRSFYLELSVTKARGE